MSDPEEWDTSIDADGNVIKSKKILETWNDEEVPDEIKDNWDDESEPEIEIPPPETKKSIPKSGNHGNKKSVELDIQSKVTLNPKINGHIPQAPLSAEEQLIEKLRLQKIQESQDLELAKEILGIDSCSNFNSQDYKSQTPSQNSTNQQQQSTKTPMLSIPFETLLTSISDLPRNTRSDFEQILSKLKTILDSIKDSSHFHYLAEELIKHICYQISATDVKKLSIMMDSVSQEKLKAAKQQAKNTGGGPSSEQLKKKGVSVTSNATSGKLKLPTLKKTSEKDYNQYMAQDYDDYDMF